MTTNQIEYWRNKENERHNAEQEAIGRANAYAASESARAANRQAAIAEAKLASSIEEALAKADASRAEARTKEEESDSRIAGNYGSLFRGIGGIASGLGLGSALGHALKRRAVDGLSDTNNWIDIGYGVQKRAGDPKIKAAKPDKFGQPSKYDKEMSNLEQANSHAKAWAGGTTELTTGIWIDPNMDASMLGESANRAWNKLDSESKKSAYDIVNKWIASQDYDKLYSFFGAVGPMFPDNADRREMMAFARNWIRSSLSPKQWSTNNKDKYWTDSASSGHF